jgi:hypothetical protein
MELTALIVACLLAGQTERDSKRADGGARPSRARAAAPAEEMEQPGDTEGEAEADEEADETASNRSAKENATDKRTQRKTRDAAEEDDDSSGKATAGDDTTLVPVNSAPVTPGAAETLIAQLALPNEPSLTGSSVSLVEVLSRSPDRRRQIELTHAYWNLSAAVADYETCVVELAGLERLLPETASDGRRVADLELEAQLAAAHARGRELELNVDTAQYALSDLAGWQNIKPLPGDAPHTGPYLTRAHEIYGARPAPPRVHLIDRVLPLRLKSLAMRANAVRAAHDAAESAEQAYDAAAGDPAGGNLAIALTAVAELARQQRAFVAAVRDYNHDIAEYTLGIAELGRDAKGLVELLIVPANQSPVRVAPGGGKPQVTQGPGGVKRAGFDALPDVMTNGRRRNEPTLAPPQRGGAKRDAIESRRVVRKPPANGGAAEPTEQGGENIGLYTALRELPPKRRTQKLGSLLHWDRTLPDALGVAATLEQCFDRAAGVDRASLIKTYWRTRERVARYQLAAQRIEQLDALMPTAVRAGVEPGGAAAMLRLQRARLAAQADLEAARVELLVSQFALALVGRWPLDGRWPVPSTAPHGGSYRLGPDPQRAGLARQGASQRWAARIPMLHGVLVDRADSIVAIDAARALATSRYESGSASLDDALETIDRQSAESSAFLVAQTEYNLEIADFVLSIQPAGTPDQRLVESLVLTPSAESTSQ